MKIENQHEFKLGSKFDSNANENEIKDIQLNHLGDVDILSPSRIQPFCCSFNCYQNTII